MLPSAARPDDSPTTSQGLPQSITLKFERPVQPSRVLLTFAGGFVGSATTLSSAPSSSASGSSSSSAQKDWRLRKRFFPDDSNRRQAFELAPDEAVEPEGSAELEGEQRQQSEDDGWAREWKIEFEKSSDFFGRITVYELEVWGWEMEGEEPQT